MTGTRDDFLSVARSAADLLRAPAVAAAWSERSALAKFSVGGLAGHLAYQILAVPQALADPAPQEPSISLLEHYGRVAWIGAGLRAELTRDGVRGGHPSRPRRGGLEGCHVLVGHQLQLPEHGLAASRLPSANSASMRSSSPGGNAYTSGSGPATLRQNQPADTRHQRRRPERHDAAVRVAI